LLFAALIAFYHLFQQELLQASCLLKKNVENVLLRG
jgi:hypothetical protein